MVKFGGGIGAFGNFTPAAGSEAASDMSHGALQARYLGEDIFLIFLSEITQTGSNVETMFNIPFTHELLEINIKHTDSSKGDSTDSLDYNIKHRLHPNLWSVLRTDSATIASDINLLFKHADFLPGQYQVNTDTTNTDIIYLEMRIKGLMFNGV